MFLSLLAFALALFQTAPAKPVAVDTPSKVAELDAGKLKGEPTELAWSPDGTQLFLQTSERDNRGMTKNPRYFVMAAADGKPKPVTAKPDWEAEYWAWKANKFAPGSTAVAIDVQEEMKQASATTAPMGGVMAKGGTVAGNGATTVEDATLAASQMQRVHVFTLTLKGETVGEFINQQFLPGYTFGWSPKALGMIAYANPSGRLAVMDLQGHKQQMDSTKNVLLPSWSTDGAKIAFLERTGKNKYDLYVANVRQ